jgi:hypothetical protein
VIHLGRWCMVACLLVVVLLPVPAAAGAGAVPVATDTLSAPAGAAQVAPPRGPRRLLSFTPHRRDECAAFVVTETSVNRVDIQTGDAMDQYLVTDCIGLMMNLDPRWAVGGAVELHWALGTIKVAPAVRCRRWFGREQSVEASLGYISDGEPGLVGPIVSARYSPFPGLCLQGGVARYREQRYAYDPVTYRGRTWNHDTSRAFGGVGLSGPGGAAIWGIQALAVGVAIALFAGMGS